jgi:PIN domain nuclease of toxin-antitoxin system
VDLLLDTHVFIWWTAVDPRLAEAARAAIADPANRVIVSAATVWEIAIKRATGKLSFPDDILKVLANTGFNTLDITPRHADAAGSLPMHHFDPFDRMLIAQARVEGLVLATQDRQLPVYGIPVLGVPF